MMNTEFVIGVFSSAYDCLIFLNDEQVEAVSFRFAATASRAYYNRQS